MGVVSVIRLHLPEVAQLVASVNRAAEQLEFNTKNRSVHWTVAGQAYERWEVATQELVRVTVAEISRTVGVTYAQPAAEFVYQAAYYVLMAVVAGTIDNSNLPGNLSTAKGLSVPGYGLPSFATQVQALRDQIADLPASYRRTALGEWGPPGSARPLTRATSGPILSAWDDMLKAVTRTN